MANLYGMLDKKTMVYVKWKQMLASMHALGVNLSFRKTQANRMLYVHVTLHAISNQGFKENWMEH